MSGSSLDGLDIAEVLFEEKMGEWSYKLEKSACLPLTDEWTDRLQQLTESTAEEYLKAHVDFGKFVGQAIVEYIAETEKNIDLIASHGHTIFHNPAKNYTGQIGDGAVIAAITGIDCLSDLRAIDIARGGQGAPIVPIGDQLLFGDYKYCLNLGGIANISEKNDSGIVAYDICGCNQLLNKAAGFLGYKYDEGGKLASGGVIDMELLNALNSSKYYQQKPPKSLANSWLRSVPGQMVADSELSAEDILATLCEHIAHQIAACVSNEPGGKILVTGGGAYNAFLIERLAAFCSVEIVIPEKEIIEFKEALVMAFIGALNLAGQHNVYASVTGASADSILGALHKAR